MNNVYRFQSFEDRLPTLQLRHFAAQQAVDILLRVADVHPLKPNSTNSLKKTLSYGSAYIGLSSLLTAAVQTDKYYIF